MPWHLSLSLLTLVFSIAAANKIMFEVSPKCAHLSSTRYSIDSTPNSILGLNEYVLTESSQDYCSLPPFYRQPFYGQGETKVGLMVQSGDCDLNVIFKNVAPLRISLLLIKFPTQTAKSARKKQETVQSSNLFKTVIIDDLQYDNISKILRECEKVILRSLSTWQSSLPYSKEIRLPEVYFNIDEKWCLSYLSEFYFWHMYEAFEPKIHLQHKIVYNSIQWYYNSACLMGSQGRMICYESKTWRSSESVLKEQLRSYSILNVVGQKRWWQYVQLYSDNLCQDSSNIEQCVYSTMLELRFTALQAQRVKQGMKRFNQESFIDELLSSSVLVAAETSLDVIYPPQIYETLCHLCDILPNKPKEECSRVRGDPIILTKIHDTFKLSLREPNMRRSQKVQQIVQVSLDDSVNQLLLILVPSHEPFTAHSYIDLFRTHQKFQVLPFTATFVGQIDHKRQKDLQNSESYNQSNQDTELTIRSHFLQNYDHLQQVIKLQHNQMLSHQLQVNLSFNHHIHYTLLIVPYQQGQSLSLISSPAYILLNASQQIVQIQFQTAELDQDHDKFLLTVQGFSSWNLGGQKLIKSRQSLRDNLIFNASQQHNILQGRQIRYVNYPFAAVSTSKYTYQIPVSSIVDQNHCGLSEDRKPVECIFSLIMTPRKMTLAQVNLKVVKPDNIMQDYNEMPQKSYPNHNVTVARMEFNNLLYFPLQLCEIRATIHWKHPSRVELRFCYNNKYCPISSLKLSQLADFMGNTSLLETSKRQFRGSGSEIKALMWHPLNMPKRYQKLQSIVVYAVFINLNSSKAKFYQQKQQKFELFLDANLHGYMMTIPDRLNYTVKLLFGNSPGSTEQPQRSVYTGLLKTNPNIRVYCLVYFLNRTQIYMTPQQAYQLMHLPEKECQNYPQFYQIHKTNRKDVILFQNIVEMRNKSQEYQPIQYSFGASPSNDTELTYLIEQDQQVLAQLSLANSKMESFEARSKVYQVENYLTMTRQNSNFTWSQYNRRTRVISFQPINPNYQAYIKLCLQDRYQPTKQVMKCHDYQQQKRVNYSGVSSHIGLVTNAKNIIIQVKFDVDAYLNTTTIYYNQSCSIDQKIITLLRRDLRPKVKILVTRLGGITTRSKQIIENFYNPVEIEQKNNSYHMLPNQTSLPYQPQTHISVDNDLESNKYLNQTSPTVIVQSSNSTSTQSIDYQFSPDSNSQNNQTQLNTSGTYDANGSSTTNQTKNQTIINNQPQQQANDTVKTDAKPNSSSITSDKQQEQAQQENKIDKLNQTEQSDNQLITKDDSRSEVIIPDQNNQAGGHTLLVLIFTILSVMSIGIIVLLFMLWRRMGQVERKADLSHNRLRRENPSEDHIPQHLQE